MKSKTLWLFTSLIYILEKNPYSGSPENRPFGEFVTRVSGIRCVAICSEMEVSRSRRL